MQYIEDKRGEREQVQVESIVSNRCDYVGCISLISQAACVNQQSVWRKIHCFTALTSSYCCCIHAETRVLLLWICLSYFISNSNCFRKLECWVVSVHFCGCSSYYIYHVRQTMMKKKTPVENGVDINCRKSLSVTDCDSFQHFKKNCHESFSSSNEMLTLDTFGITVNLRDLHETEHWKNHSMMDVWYLLTFTVLSKGPSAAKPKKILQFTSNMLHTSIFSGCPSFRDYLQHISSFVNSFK